MISVNSKMQTSKLAVVLVAFVVVTANGHPVPDSEAVLGGACPTIKYITNLTLPLTLGSWFLPFTSLDSAQCYNNEGRTGFIAQHTASTLNIEMCCRCADTPDYACCGVDVGSGTASALAIPGVFEYVFADGSRYNLYVLSLNYKRLTVVYGCKSAASPSERDEVVLVFSRSNVVDSALEQEVAGVLQQNDIDFSKVKRISHGPTIPYVPGVRSCDSQQ